MHRLPIAALALLAPLCALPSCSSSGAAESSGTASSAGVAGNGSAGALGSGASGAASGGGAGSNAGNAGAASGGAAGAFSGPASTSKGWLYTMGNKIYVSNGTAAGTQWMGRGVNMDDLFFCGYNYMLETPNAEALLETEVQGLFSAWRPNFVRMSLSMDSFPTVVSGVNDDAAYNTPMTNVIKAIGANPNTYVLVTLRSDVTMVDQDPGNKEATGVPSDANTTPDKALYPTGTDAVYVALVDTFAQDNFVLFGLTNEAGGNAATFATLSAAMDHAVSTIRAEEDRLGVPHHLVSVQGTGYTSNISNYAAQPLTEDNVVYEVHGYPPPTSSYTYPNIPVIIGEYGTLAGDGQAFYTDVEAKQIPNLAWDFDPYSNCAPDLLNITQDATMLTPSDWGNVVQPYLTSHAPPK